MTARATMLTERRCVKRKRPGGISYFEFEAGSGGIVLDASEKGLRFQAADAVRQIGPSRVWISPRPEERIEVTGNVVWMDRSRKTGGLRFIETRADSSQKIRSWLGQAGDSEVSPQVQEFPLPAWASQDLSVRHPARQDVNPPGAQVTPRVKTGAGEAQRVELRPIPGLPSLFTSNLPPPPLDSQTSQGRITYRIATGFLVGVVLVAGIVLFDMFRPQIGESLVRLGEKINGGTNLQPQNPSPLPSSAQTPQPPVISEAKPDAVQSEARPYTPQKEKPEDSEKGLESSGQVNTQTSDPVMPRIEPDTKEAANRSPHQQASIAAPDRSAEATRLWSAVASGDSAAEVNLARLYLRGEGVPRNCEQAKVLLRAAAKGGSAEARRQLKKLRISGC